MPKVLDLAPPWLSRPSPGADFFLSSGPDAGKPKSTTGSSREQQPYYGPKRTIARRGNEVFALVDNQIRWSNLASLKDGWHAEVRDQRSKDEDFVNGTGTVRRKKSPFVEAVNGAEGDVSTGTERRKESYYRVLTVPVYGQITQLIPSPNGAFLAIVTPHTIHIAVLPDPSHLAGPDYSPLRLKTFHLGPTTHVIPESPVISALWHPLGVHDNKGGCIITVTQDAVVRVWEIDRSNHWSFDRPTLAVDLTKLVDGTSLDEDFAPSGFGQKKGFSADSFDMEVASACFGGHGYDDEDAWAPMTLWVAMRPGDIYALCPLLPSKWVAPSLTIPSLTTSIVRKLASVEDEKSDVEEDEKWAIEQQFEWFKEIDNQEPTVAGDGLEADADIEVWTRPVNPSPIPRLQGPFYFGLGDDAEDADITDIFVIASKADIEDLISSEDDPRISGDEVHEGMSATVICVVTANGRVYVCLELDGVEGQWLPKSKKGAFTTPVSNPSDLLLLETLETVRKKYQQSNSWPLFTPDVQSRYGFFVTTANNVTFLSILSWAERLEAELQSPDTAGSAFRIKVLCDGSMTLREQILQVTDQDSGTGEPEHLPCCLVSSDFDLGYLLLTYSSSRVHSAILDSPAFTNYAISKGLSLFESDATTQQAPALAPRRAPYQPPSALYTEPILPTFIDDHVPHGKKHTLKEPIRLSPSTLDVITAAHRILSARAHALERAASDLFRRCGRLEGEMRDQLQQIADIAERIKSVSNGFEKDKEKRRRAGVEGNLDERLEGAKERQRVLVERYERVRGKLSRAGGRPISEKEKGWMGEVDKLAVSVGLETGDGDRERGELVKRLDTVKSLSEDLVAEVKRISERETSSLVSSTPDRPSTPSKVPQRLQRAKVAEAMSMVDRESAVIDAISSRLEKLTASAYGS